MPYADSDYERSWKMQTKGVMLYPATMEHLIAAAPELLAACRGMVAAFDYGDAASEQVALVWLRKAIAKAEGRSE